MRRARSCRRTGREKRAGRSYDASMSRGTRRGRPPFADVLTPTEWRILHAVQHGLTNQDIARRRGTSADAVKFHVANILSKLGVANRRELRRLTSKPADSALARKRSASPTTLALGQLGQVARSVRDIAESEAWYRDVLGLPHLYTFGTLAFFDLAGVRLMLSQSATAPVPESLLYFVTSDIESAHASARGARHRIRQCTSPDPSTRRWHGRMDVLLQGPRRACTRADV